MEPIIRKIEPLIQPAPEMLCVAAYARVSCGKDAMLHSLSEQVICYSTLIQKHPGWQYAGVYADEAKTGTKDTRPEFQRLLADCRAGKIQMVITKTISRFARNTVTLLETVRKLKELGIDVWFETENIHSISGDGEFMLSILASYAQEESRSVSENCKWRIRKEFKQGNSMFMRIYGYRWEKGTLVVEPKEAETVRLIFALFQQGYGRTRIARDLNERGIKPMNVESWNENTVAYILKNEKDAIVSGRLAKWRKAPYLGLSGHTALHVVRPRKAAF